MFNEAYMREAIELARSGIENANYTPFGALVVKDGEIIGRGQSTVVEDRDCTAHAEVNAIRAANRHLKTHLLEGADLYSSGFPCPLCLSAAKWAGIENIFYAATLEDSQAVGFEDLEMYSAIGSVISGGTFGFRRLCFIDSMQVDSRLVLNEWKRRFTGAD